MKAWKKLTSVLALALCMALAMIAPGLAGAAENSSVANRFNVVLVIDKSGSLCNVNRVGTDPDGLRYDAMKLFLGLLTETGNNVGVIAFDDSVRYDSGMRPVGTMAEKKQLVSDVEALGTSYDTDIGGAVLRATELLRGMQEKNSLPCAILLLTDGMTDFPPGPGRQNLINKSREVGAQALQAAREAGITIHGILLNVDGRADSGIEELRTYTDGTGGQYGAVASPEDLAAAFSRFYSIINRTEYSGADRVVFSDDGRAETGFLIPGFGVEEVNLVIEHELTDGSSAFDSIESIRILQPDGAECGTASHLLSTSRYLLIKLPDPMPGKWNVTLQGEPGDSIDICLIYNASLSAALSAECAGGSPRVLEPIRFEAAVTDGGKALSAEQLKNIQAALRVTGPGPDQVREIPMELSDSVCGCELSFEDGGEYSFTALISLADIEVCSNTLRLSVAVPPPVAARAGVSSLTDEGTVRDNLWELDLSALFEDPKGTGLTYSLSDDLGGALKLDGSILRADLSELDSASFTVIATDGYGLSAELPFALEIRRPAPTHSSVTDMLADGVFRGDVWELNLNALFGGAEPGSLRYTLSDDLGGALTIENGVLRARLSGLEAASFTVTATDAVGLSTELPFSLSVPAPEAKLSSVSALTDCGTVRGGVWELDLDTLFADPKGTGLTYTLSDDLGGALSIENGVLRADLSKLDSASFTVTATDACGLIAELPFSLSVPAPASKLSAVSSVSDCGSAQDGVWEVDLNTLFENGDTLSFTLSDDLGGALSIENGVLRADLSKLDSASFSVTATDENGLSAELPFSLSVPAPEAKAASVSAISDCGSVQDGIWEVDLNTLFENGDTLSFTLSDDLGGALSIENGILRADLSKLDGASFSVTATDENGLSAELPFSLSVPAPEAKAASVSAISDCGSVQDGIWEVDLNTLFKNGDGLSFALSDDLGGALSIENGVLRADLSKLDGASFSVTATDENGLSAELPFSLSVPAPKAKLSAVSSVSDCGSAKDGVWEVDLKTLFENGDTLSFALSDDLGGALSIENGVLRADLSKLDGASFTVLATDENGMTAELPFSLSVPAPEAKLSAVSSVSDCGSAKDGVWEVDLNTLFENGNGLSFALSDDLGGALSIENGILRADLSKLDGASFSVLATDENGLSAELPFSLSVPAPEAKVPAISDTVKTGWFQKGTWELPLDGLFEDPKGTRLSYALSDDLSGALEIRDSVLRAACAGIGTADFTLIATDALGLSAEIPVRLVEKNVTWIYVLLLVLLLLAVCAILYYRKRRASSR